ncbi:MAG TPA: hypothetical protein VHE33_01525, partial [Acidobacteriaceae bacterium]|nr:hypothetical protein [Acidobacteriaceae bacterium]
MVFRSVLAACTLAAFSSIGSLAQSTTPSSQQTPATQTQPQQNSPQPPAPTAPPKLELHDLPPEAHTMTPAEQDKARQQEAMNAAMRLAALQAHWGPQMTTPGLSLAMTEVSRTKTADGTQIKYHLTGSGFSPTDKLTLVRWPLDAQAKVLMGGISFDAKGVAVCSDSPGADSLAAAAANLSAAPAPNATAPAKTQSAPAPPPSCVTTMKPEEPVEIETTAAPGEAIRVALVTADRKRAAETSAIPFPIVNEDKSCKLQVILSVKDGGLVLLEGT